MRLLLLKQLLLLMFWRICLGNPPESIISNDPVMIQKLNEIGDQILQSAQDKDITLNGNRITVRDLYNDVVSTANTLRVSPSEEILWNFVNVESEQPIGQEPLAVERFTARGKYINRKFVSHNLPKTRLAGLSPKILEDTPTSIANNLAISTEVQPPLLIMGDARSGKTCALRKIQSVLVQMLPTHWTIFISAPDLTPIFNDHPPRVETVRSIVEREIGSERVDLFHDLLTINPKKIIFLVDSADGLVFSPHGRSIIESVLSSGATVIMTGRPYALNYLKHFSMHTVKIEEMSLTESAKFLRAVWHHSLMAEISNQPSSSSASSINDYTARLDTFTQVFTHTLFKTNLPRQPVTLTVLAEVFQRQSSPVLEEVFHAYPIGCLDYILDPLIQPYDLPVALENVVINKKVLFDTIVSKYVIAGQNQLHFQYGITALVNHFTAYGALNDVRDLLAPIEDQLTVAKKTLERLQHAAVFVDILDGHRINFIHQEFEHYFAAKAVIALTEIMHPVECAPIWSTILLNDYYRSIVSFIDGYLRTNPHLTIPISVNQQFHLEIHNQMAKNAINNQFQYLLINLFKYQDLIPHKSRPQLHLFFLQKSHKFFAPNLVFGMFRAVQPHPDADPFETPALSQIECTFVEMLIESNMLQALQVLQPSIWLIQTDLHYKQCYIQLLRRAFVKPLPNPALIRFLMKNTVSLSFPALNELLFLCVNEAGNSCRWPAQYLVEQGAVPAKTTVEGQTLLHAAVKWNNVHLLRFCIEDLHVPAIDTVDNAGDSVFTRALDANPSPFSTFVGWWEMMNYLVQNVKNLKLLPVRSVNSPQPLLVPQADITSPWMKILSYSRWSSATRLAHFSSVNSVNIHRGELNKEFRAYMTNIARFISFKSSWQLDSKTLALRRNLWLSRVRQQQGASTISISEMLVYFRGIVTLGAARNAVYLSTLMSALSLEREYLSSESIERLLGAMCDNIFDHNDLMNLQSTVEYLTGHQMLSSTQSTVLKPFLKKILDRLHTSTIRSMQSSNHESREISLSERLLQCNHDYRPEINDPEVIIKLYKMVTLLEYNYSINPTGTDNAILQCLSTRRSRDVRSRFCLISWTDVDAFNDAHRGDDRRIVSRVRVDSDKFLQVIDETQRAHAAKANQLVGLVRALSRAPGVIVGASRMLVRDVVERGGLDGYRKFQRTMAVINDAWRQGSARPQLRSWQFPSRTVALHAAASIPLLRGLHVTIATCLQHTDDPDKCWYASGALALSGGLTALSFTAGKFIPWSINHFTQAALDFLPVSAPTVIREYVGHMRYLGLKYGVKTFGYALGIIGIGFDVFNVVQMSQMIDACSRPGSECRDRDKAEYIVTLTFSCVSITVAGGLMMSGVGFVPGVLIGLALLVLEQVTLSLSAVHYYSRDYHTTWTENMRIFWHKFFLQPVPVDVQALESRSDWTNRLQHQIELQFDESDERVVAYAVGLGVIAGGNVTAGYAFIDMEHDDLKNTGGLSRVRAKAQNWTTLLCAPRYDPKAPYNDWPTQSASSVYSCDNAFVVAHKNRWQKRSHESYIFYNLEYVSEGTIVGSNSLNNLFSIYGSEANRTLDIVGGNGNITNTYVVHSESFTGSIKLPGGKTRNILDFSAYNGVMTFQWFPESGVGNIRNKNGEKTSLELKALSQPINLGVIGRSGEMDIFACGYSELPDADVGATSIVVNGGGGQPLNEMDRIIDCEKSVIHPFTHVIGSHLDSGLISTAYVALAPVTTSEEFVGKAIIDLNQSRFIVTFIKSPVFVSTLHVKYMPQTNTLVWKVSYSSTQVLYLSINSYRSVNLSQPIDIAEDSIDSVAVNCVFIDGYHGSTVFPVIEIPSNTSASVDVTKFNIFKTIDSILLKDVLTAYRVMQIKNDRNFLIVTKLTHGATGQSFTFGSEANDRFYVDGSSTYFYGGNGQDIYAVSRNSSKLVWIENEASDDALDSLIIPSGMCDESLRVVEGSEDTDCCGGSEDDVTLVCTFGNSTSQDAIKIVLRNYLLDQWYRHLQIYWRNATHVLLPREWTNRGTDPLSLGLYFDLAGWQSTVLTLTSSDTYLVLGVADSANPVIAYNSGERDLVLATKFVSRELSSFVLLQDFFAENTSDAVINPEWERSVIFMVHGSINNLQSALNASDILYLYLETALDNNNPTDSDFIKEYFVNMTNEGDENQTIIINHNNGSSRQEDQIGVLALIGTSSGPLEATWTDNGTSLALRSVNTQIIVKNWCYTTRHRLHRIEWYRNFYDRPSVIRQLDHLGCPRRENPSSKLSIEQLNARLHVIYRIVLDSDDNDNDDTQLVRCVGSIFAENLVHKFFFRLFGFSSLNDQIHFFYNNCYALLTESKLQALSYDHMRKTLHRIIDDFLASNPFDKERKSLILLQKKFDGVGNDCWQNFTYGLKNITSDNQRSSVDLFNIIPKCSY